MLLRVKERLNVKLLEGAILNLLKHHDALRFRYEQLPNGTWRQRNEGTDELSVLHVVKRNQVNEKEWNKIIQEEMNINQASFNLVTGPLMRVVYFEDNLTGNDRIFWVIHHLVVDGVSWRILLEDLQVVYNQMKQGQEVRLPAKSTSFKEWSERLQTYSDSGISKEVQNYWNEQVEKETMKIPMDYPIQETTEESIDQVTRTLGIEETQTLLYEFLVTHKTRIDEVLLTALGQAIVDCINQQTVSIHLEGHGREEMIEGIDLSRTVGWFTSIYPVHLNFQGTQTPIEGLKAVKEQLRRIPNRGVDYGILRYLNKGLLPFYQQKPSISFNYLGQFDQVFSRDSLFMQETGFTFLDHAPDSKPSHLIDVIGMVKDEKLHFIWMYSREQFSKLKIQVIADGMLRHLRQLINKPTTESAFTVSDFADAEDLTEESLSKVLLKLTKRGCKMGDVIDIYGLSPLQKEYCFILYTIKMMNILFLYCTSRFLARGQLDVATFEKAWEYVIQRHEVLRSVFVWEEVEKPLQAVYERLPFTIHQEDWSTYSHEEKEKKLQQFLTADRRKGFYWMKHH